MADGYQLQKLFFDLPDYEIREIRDKAIALIKECKTLMNVSAGGKSGSKQYTLPPAHMLIEANAALKHVDPANNGRRRRFTVSRFGCYGL